MIARALIGLAVVAALVLGVLYAAGKGWFGEDWGAGVVTEVPRPPVVVRERTVQQRRTAGGLGVRETKQILFGDLHVHSTYSIDAFTMALPLAQGEGAYPVADACDFARYCSALDFWSINDHALGLTQQHWRDTIDSIRQCNAVATDPANPDTVAFLGWEWTQMGTRAENHYGHKNVIFRDLADDAIPTRPIAAAPPPDMLELQGNPAPPAPVLGLVPFLSRDPIYFDWARFTQEVVALENCPSGVPERELPLDCRETAATPAELFAKLDDWGFDSLVIPHGTTWGLYTPLASSWSKQLRKAQHDPERQKLVEIFSGHGNSEEFRAWREADLSKQGAAACPAPTRSYLPSCWQAGEIIRKRCLEAGESANTCEARAVDARALYVEGNVAGFLTVPGAQTGDWLDAGQCRDCFQPAFNYRPRSSVQYMMALRNFADAGLEGAPDRFRFGFIASSDNHSARPGTGYKEVRRNDFTESRFQYLVNSFIGGVDQRDPAPEAVPFDAKKLAKEGVSFFGLRETERGASFFLNGGLVAAHANGRSREAIWNALERREVYGTSGPRILLWFDLLNAPGSHGRELPMGTQVTMQEDPIFRVRAAGSFAQRPGCPSHVGEALGPERLARICKGECYNPSDRRRLITRIEIVRIRPQQSAGEDVATLIDDPWRVLACEPDPVGCTVHFTDPDFASTGRDTLYYARAIEEPSLAVNADNLRCERDEEGNCVRIRPCVGVDPADDCLAETEERAWSSPIFVDFSPEAVQRAAR